MGSWPNTTLVDPAQFHTDRFSEVVSRFHNQPKKTENLSQLAQKDMSTHRVSVSNSAPLKLSVKFCSLGRILSQFHE